MTQEGTPVHYVMNVFAESRCVCPRQARKSFLPALIAIALLAPTWSMAQSQAYLPDSAATERAPADDAALPDAPSAAKDHSFGASLGRAVKTIGEDELHIIKSPFSVSALKWDALAV